MQLNKKNRLITILLVSLLIGGCVGDNESTKQLASNNGLATTNSFSGISPLALRANEHHIEKPSDEKKKEEYAKIKDKTVVDNDKNNPAGAAKKDTIHELLEKVPTELTQQFNKLGGQIKLISDNWQDSLDENGVKISSETKVINKFGKPVHISDAIVYFDPDSQAPTIYVNSNINYENNADNRRELQYGLIRGLLQNNNVVFDEDFVNAVKSYTQVAGIDFYKYPELETISKFAAEDIKLTANKDKMATLFASVMADSFEYKTYAETWPVMADYLNKFEQDILVDAEKPNKEEIHESVLNLIKSKITKREDIGELKYDKEVWKGSNAYKLYKFQGIVYRGDSRLPSDIEQIGFNNEYTKKLEYLASLDPLSVLQVSEEDRSTLYAALGFFSSGSTHDIGVSTSKTIQQAAKYPPKSDVRYIYLIDSTQLNGYDIPSVTKQISVDQSTFIPNNEVNMFDDIPPSAIVGYSYIKKQEMYGKPDDEGNAAVEASIIELLNSRIVKNNNYVPSPWALGVKQDSYH
ncbi:MAG: hypothetical protein K2X04_07430 [Burkholderiales bacterium]|nr:hypothetical protein [Burkholderiales bacterium]